MAVRGVRIGVAALCAVAGTVVGAGPAFADDPGNSDAAHMCDDGLQIDEYVLDGQPGLELPSTVFGDLLHGSGPDRSVGVDVPIGAWVITDGHGQCVSFFAEAKKGTKGGGRVTFHDIQISHVYDKASPSL